MVLGFHGVEKNQFTGEWIVRERNAHAWVEAYLRPEDCTEEMLQNGLASAGGAWMRLDPTPGSGVPEANVGEEAIDLARNVWDDYVLGNDEDGSLTNEANSAFSILGFLDSTDFQKWERRVDGVKDFTNTRAFKFGAGTVIMVLFLIAWYRAAEPNEQRKRKTGRLRRLFAGAISLISPELGKWVMAGSSVSRPTAFYERMSKLLAPHRARTKPKSNTPRVRIRRRDKVQ